MATLKPKVDPQTTAEIEKLLNELIHESPRLALSNGEENMQDLDSTLENKDVVDIYRTRLKISGPN